MSRSIILLGGPDSGKTNYVGRLWRALDSGTGALHAAEQPNDISFVLEITDHLFQGGFAPRSEFSGSRRNFEVVVAASDGGSQTRIVIPDMSGEVWRNAVLEGEIAPEWMDELRSADAALLFVRVGSDQDVRPLDWVTTRRHLERLGVEDDQGPPTQVMLCELIRYLQVSLAARKDGGLPRLSVVVAAWDLVDEVTFSSGPVAYLEREYPLLGGKLANLDDLEVRVFGMSVVGGDLKSDAAYRQAYLQTGLDAHGWVAACGSDHVWRKEPDISLPLAWAVGL